MCKSNDKCEWLGIGSDVLDSSELFKEIEAANKLLNSRYNGVSVFSKTNRPHLNLYDLDVPSQAITDITLELEKLLKDQPSIKVKLTDLSYFPFGVFYLKLENSAELKSLHTGIVQTVSKFRGDCVCEDYLKPGRAYNKNQDAMLATYGNPFVMDQYFPHISLGFIKDRSSQLEKIRLNLLEQVRVKEFPINNLQLVGSEENGHKVIQVIQLSL